ncbi:methyl-accepting chemotaxis protein [Treponema sp.]|uniref:methyl-accepting chemotaxis protein n=1 Tax=Treponema sp. TaxID=166 RepID=UPI003F11059D
MKTRKLSSLFLYFIFLAVLFCIAFFATRAIFNSKAKKILRQVATIKELEFSSNLDGQLMLATKMAKSPLISAYMENPKDEFLSEAAMEEILSYQDAFKGKNTFSIADADLLYYSNGKYLYTLDKKAPGNEWFEASISVPQDYTFNVSYEAAIKKSMLWVNAVVRNSSGKGIGLIGTGVDLSDFVDMMYKNLQDGISMFFYNHSHEITGASDTSLLEAKAKIESQIPEFQKFQGLSKEKGFYAGTKGCYLVSSIPSVNWTMLLFIPFSLKNALTSAVAPLLGIVVIVLAINAVIILKRFIQPLYLLNQAVTELSSGNADLTKRLSSNSSDKNSLFYKIELGFNSFIEKLHQIMTVIKTSKNDLFDSLVKLRNSIHGIVNSIGEINTHIGGMENAIANQTGSINSASQVVGQISTEITSLNKMILSQNENVSEAGASVKQMISNIDSVNNSVSQLSESFLSLESNANEGVSKQQEVNARISDIKSQSEMLQDANLIISSIASQTNLLAMNAAIEAAHAGEAGKGFSVVADEIRKLSETSSEQSKTIGLQLTAIQNSISEIVGTSEESQKVLHSVVENIHNTNSLVKSIKVAMEEQKHGSAQINNALVELQRNSEEVKNASSQTEKKNESILAETKNLQSSAESIKQSMDNMSGCAHLITRESEILGSLSDNVDSSLDKISREIDLFKV